MRQFQNATKKLSKKNNDKYNVDRKFCKLFCGFADSPRSTKLSSRWKKNPLEDLLPSVKWKPILSDLPEILVFISESFCMHDFNTLDFICIHSLILEHKQKFKSPRHAEICFHKTIVILQKNPWRKFHATEYNFNRREATLKVPFPFQQILLSSARIHAVYLHQVLACYLTEKKSDC